MRDLSIIIVSWNVADLLAACLDSILRSEATFADDDGRLSIEIIVVDSASSDHSVAMLRERYPQVRLSAQTENVGFTRGNNLGLAMAQGRYVFLLNPDTEIIGDALQRMIAFMDAHTDVGILGPQTHNSDGSVQSSRRRFPTLATGFFESTWLQPFAPKSLLDHFYARDIADDATADVDWVQGSALLARREVYEQIGGLDTGYVMFSEELDWCKRARLAGWRVVYLGSAHVTHHGGKSTEQVVARKHIHFQESKLRYYRKYHGAFVAHILRAFLLLNYGWQIVLEAVKAILGHKVALRRERIDAYWRVLRSGLRVH
ncbi:MAG: glycosyltransferase family 2 protein [Anaerolineae bacterium]|nr:glycosyltransferase family 2 protein [Anaerolineae bacterium]